MGSNFLLIPLLLVFLSKEQVGLWYVFVAISGFSQLLEFGFTATLSRNILYCISGVRRLTKQGCDYNSVAPGIDWHLLRAVLTTSKVIYAVMGIVALGLSASLGTVYVYGVTYGFAIEGSLLSWLVFVIAIFTNLYFLYCLTFLRGVGDVAGENKAKTIARISQLFLTAVLLIAGLGLVAAAIGFFIYSFLMRLIAMRQFKKHSEIQEGLMHDGSAISKEEMLDVLKTISFVAWRDGVVSLAWYGATQAASLISSSYLGLEETATYSVMLQFASAIYNLSSAYMRSCFPMFQSASVHGDVETQRRTVETGISGYVVLYVCGYVAAALILPLLVIFKKDFICDQGLFAGIAMYYFLLNQHSLFCNLIVCMNEIPYFRAYIISTCCGIALSILFCGPLQMGPWGLVLGQALPQLMYNNWRWPLYVLTRVKTSYFSAIGSGCRWWLTKARTMVSRNSK